MLQRRHTDEFAPPAYSRRDLEVIDRVVRDGPRSAERTGATLGDYWSGRTGTAAGLIGLNRAAGCDFYRVPSEAAVDREAACEAFAGDATVIDVQTQRPNENRCSSIRPCVPSLW
jgi:hypothetical protein